MDVAWIQCWGGFSGHAPDQSSAQELREKDQLEVQVSTAIY
jgi:hypothetical protein